jgi:hypothetical protein
MGIWDFLHLFFHHHHQKNLNDSQISHISQRHFHIFLIIIIKQTDKNIIKRKIIIKNFISKVQKIIKLLGKFMNLFSEMKIGGIFLGKIFE